MTNEEAIKILEKMKARMIPLGPLLEGKSKDEEAVDMAIEALSKQCASSEQADKKLFDHGYWLAPGEVFISHNVLNEVLNTIIKSMNTEQRKIDSILAKTDRNDEAIRKDDHIADDSKMVDQFREATKKTEDVPDINVGKTDFKPGEKTEKIPYKKPEIIQCKDCLFHSNDCEGTEWLRSECGFHGKAERRNDDSD